jgi:outer membrane protein TolC
MNKLWFALCVLLIGCSVGPKYEKPAVELPETWKETAPPHSYPGAEDGKWWTIYQDATLEFTVEEALTYNADLLIAAARVDEARALLGEANSFFWPRVDAQASASRQEVSTRTATFFSGIPREYNSHRARSTCPTADLFGRLRSNAARELEVSEAARRGAVALPRRWQVVLALRA